MKKIILVLLALSTLLLGTLLTAKTLNAAGKDFSNVTAFSTAPGKLNFFDSNTGKLYVYNADTLECIYIGEIQTLGEPIKEIMKAEANSKNDLKAKKFPRAK